jgi:hypothetical protein
LNLLTDEPRRGTDWRPPDVALVPIWASPAHLGGPSRRARPGAGRALRSRPRRLHG